MGETKVDTGKTRRYWEENISGFAGFYDKKSEEHLAGPWLIKALYKRIVFPVEKWFMRKRHEMVCAYIEENVREGMRAADIGCGSGVYVKRMARQGASVYGLDFAESAIRLTESNLAPDEKNKVQLQRLDILAEKIPQVQIALAIGVMPYVINHEQMLDHILPYTNRLLFNFLDQDNFCNRVRHWLKALDVRHYAYHTREQIYQGLAKHAFQIESIRPLATGWMVSAIRKNAKE